MKPAPFDYMRAKTVEQAVDALAQHGDDARILAGGQSLIAMLNMRLAQPRVLVDISRMTNARAIDVADDMLRVGAAATQSQLLKFPDLAARAPLLAMALPHVGHFQTRNKGTVCGSIAHADPSSELPLCLAVLGGQVQLMSHRGRGNVERRSVAGAAFFKGVLETERLPQEVITQVTFPLARPGDGYAFHEMALRHGDFAIVAVAVKATATSIRIGVGGGVDKPRLRDWPMLEGGALDDALNALAWELDFQDDSHASARYRRHLVRTLGRRAVLEALERRAHV